MLATKLYSDAYITVEYHPDAQLIHHTIHKPIGDEGAESFKNALVAGSDALKQYGLSKWLSDDRNNGPLSQEIQDWAVEHWYPEVIGAGWTHWANVVPTEVKAAGTLMPVIHQLYEYGLHMMVFSDIDDAWEWLASVE